MNAEKLAEAKHALEAELKLVEEQLESLGKKNPTNPNDWETEVNDIDTNATEPDELADRMEEYEENEEEIVALEARRKAIREALEATEKGTYGVCGVCAMPIEENRLEADPAATTCVADMKVE